MTVNILGDTPKEQWLNAIQIFETCIVSNIEIAMNSIGAMCPCESAEEDIEYLDTARRNTQVFADEMRRLVEGAFDD